MNTRIIDMFKAMKLRLCVATILSTFPNIIALGSSFPIQLINGVDASSGRYLDGPTSVLVNSSRWMAPHGVTKI